MGMRTLHHEYTTLHHGFITLHHVTQIRKKRLFWEVFTTKIFELH